MVDTINESDEPVDPLLALDYWRAKWAKTAVNLVDILAERNALAAELEKYRNA